MKYATITGTIEFKQFYLPNKRCRKAHFRTMKKEVPLKIREFSSEELPIALRVKGREECRWEYKMDEGWEEDYRFYQGMLYRPAWDDHTGKMATVDSLPIHEGWKYFDSDEANFDKAESVLVSNPDDPDSELALTKKLEDQMANYILVDGSVYRKPYGEPYYQVWAASHVRIKEGANMPLDKHSDFTALDLALMKRMYPEVDLQNHHIKVTPGYESCIKLRRNLKSGLYTWSDDRQRYEWKMQGEGSTWAITFKKEREYDPYYAEIPATNEDEAVGKFVRRNPDISFSKLEVHSLSSGDGQN